MAYRHDCTEQGGTSCEASFRRVDQTNPNASIAIYVQYNFPSDASLTRTSITMSDIEMDDSQGEQKTRQVFVILTLPRYGLRP